MDIQTIEKKDRLYTNSDSYFNCKGKSWVNNTATRAFQKVRRLVNELDCGFVRN